MTGRSNSRDGGDRAASDSGDVEPQRFRFTMRTMFLAVSAFALLLGIVTPVCRELVRWQTSSRLLDEARAKIESLAIRRPADVPADQWQRAIDWTSNLLCQMYCIPDPKDPDSLGRLSEAFDKKARGQVYLSTLQWVWDEAENAPRGYARLAIEFRNVRLLTKDPITDEDLPDLWSLQKCLYLDLTNTDVTDAGLEHLEDSSNLQELWLHETAVTEEGVRRLQEKLPNCTIYR